MENKYSLTFPQKNIWLVEEFFGKSPINTIVGILNIHRDFNRESCECAINNMVKSNEGLRLQIEKSHEPVQYIKDYTKFDVDFFDLTLINSESKESLNTRLMLQPFTICNSPLYYFAIVKTENDAGYIFVKLHHLISDAWTFGNVATSLAEYIEGLAAEQVEYEIKPSYTEFIEAEKEYVLSERFTKDREFWKEYLKDFKEPVGLKENTDTTAIDAKRYSVNLDNNLNEMLKAYCKVNRLSPYVVFMTAFAIYMHRVTEKTDFVIGTPVLNRSNVKEKKMMGMFVSTMPVRFKIDENISFIDMCKEFAKDTMTLFRHQKFPYSVMLQDYKENEKVNTNLYDVILSYQNARAEYDIDGKYSTNWVFSTKIQNQLELHIMDMDETGMLQVHLDYLTSAFEDEEIQYIATRLFAIIEDGIKNNSKVENIEIMSKEEKDKIIHVFNDTKMDYPKDKTVIELFEEQVELNPKNIAIVFEDKKMTYKELDRTSNMYANYLIDIGVKPQDMVGILIDKSLELIVTIIALLKVGACYVPVEKNYNKERKEYIFNNANCKLVITDETEDLNINILKISQIAGNNYSSVENLNTPDSNNCVLYTSGTTGEPKGAVIVDRNITKLVRDADYITFTSEDKILQAASTSFDVSLFEIWGALLNGAELHVIKKMNLVNPSYLKEYLLDKKISILWITSALFNQMIEADNAMFNGLRRIFTGGDVISIKHVNMLIDACPKLQITNCYGPTECVAFTNTYNIIERPIKRIPLGKPISNTTGYVMDKKMRLLPLYVHGEYVIGGESVGKEYINNPEMTREKFVKNIIDNKFEIDRLYKSGDIVQMLGDGKIDFIGRRDNQIKIRGFRIELDEIKIAMQSYNKIKDAVAILKQSGNDKKIYAYYTSDVEEDNLELINYLKTKLPIYMVPSKVMQLKSLPINQNGKIDRKNLPEIKDEIIHESGNIEYTGIYKEIYNVYKNILNIENIGEYDSFFDIGGDSISVIKVISELSKKNIDVTFQDIYKYPSIKELGDMLEKSYTAESISKGIEDMDYTEIDKLLFNNITSILNEKLSIKPVGNILLTGATGFLGAHILDKFLMKNIDAKIYCIVRSKDGKSAENRLEERLKYFFGDDYFLQNKDRIIVVAGDIITDEIFANVQEKNKVLEDVNCIINSAAYVKHFGKLELFEKINTKSVENLAKLAVQYNKKLIHISTLSVSGNILENGQIEQVNIQPGTVFDETKLYIGQNLDNVYAYTKYLGEKVVYDYILNHGLDAKVIRMGNLTGRYNDGKFQPNAEENAFAQRLRTIINLGVLPDNLLDFDVEFTPIDYAAEAIVDIANISEKHNTFHLFNDNHIKMNELNKIFKNYGIYLKIITKEEMTKLLTDLVENNFTKVQGVVQDLNSNKELDYTPNTIIKEDFTKEVLKKLGFTWPILTEEYITKYLDNLYWIGFLKEANDDK